MIYCTIVARNYVPEANVLAAGLAELHPGTTLHVLVLDHGPAETTGLSADARLVSPTALSISHRHWQEMAMSYTVVELATAIKPWLLEHLASGTAEPIVYLDPDVRLYSPLHELAEAIGQHPIVVTPHLLVPKADDDALDEEASLLGYGTFNLGFLAVRHDAQPFLEWLKGRLLRRCLEERALGLFVDQKWMDLAPGYFDVGVLRHPGYNVGWWNLAERRMRWDGREYLVGDVPLRFFHFSGLQSNGQGFTRSLGRAPQGAGTNDVVRSLCHDYHTSVQDSGGRQRPAYGYGCTSWGSAISSGMRRHYLMAVLASDREEADPPPLMFDPAELGGARQWVYAYERASRRSGRLSRRPGFRRLLRRMIRAWPVAVRKLRARLTP